MKEEWRPCRRYPQFDVSSRGFVRDARTGMIKLPSVSARASARTAYLTVSLPAGDGRNRNEYLHRLVVESFIGPIPPGCVVAHRNDRKWENALENLYIATARTNAEDARRNLCHKRPRVEVAREHARGFARLRREAQRRNEAARAA